MAILAHLGCRHVQVRNVPGWLGTVDEKSLSKWLLVKAGRCSGQEAHDLFAAFFELDGNHVATLLA